MVALLSSNSLRLPALRCILGNTFQEKSEVAVIVIGRSFFDPKDQTGRMLGCDAKGQQRGDGVMSPRRFAILATALCGTVVLVGSAIAALGSFDLADIKNTRAAPIKDRATETVKTGGSNAIVVSAAPAATAITEAALPDSSQMHAPETSPVRIAAASTLDQLLHSDAKGAVSSAEPLDASLADPSQALAPETPPDAKGAVSST